VVAAISLTPTERSKMLHTVEIGLEIIAALVGRANAVIE
jgi:hypothetical protein